MVLRDIADLFHLDYVRMYKALVVQDFSDCIFGDLPRELDTLDYGHSQKKGTILNMLSSIADKTFCRPYLVSPFYELDCNPQVGLYVISKLHKSKGPLV